MPDIIQLLPDHLANQIAAGEVIQRPASAVKELLENAIDAKATDIQLIIKDSGKELIQVVDNGTGMSPIDARMSFERHATSKIRKADDLFSIRTMGFRGEALASIAAVAQVEVKTRLHTSDMGVHLIIEESTVKKQDPVACPPGTNFSIKNLFFNVPARRKFLKSNTTEFRNIIDEFTRIAMAYPHISFRLYHNNTEQFHLTSGSLKARIIELLGNKIEKQLIPVQEDTELLKINGFIGKPEAANKTRGNQYFFINNRFIKSAYLNHAVVNAFDSLISKDSYPFYALFFEMNPQKVDVNVHPTKQEVKFDDERLLYAFLQSNVKHALAKFNIAPSIDFTLNPEIQNLESVKLPQSDFQKKSIEKGYLYHSFTEKGRSHFLEKSNDRQEWNKQRDSFFPEIPKSLPSKIQKHSNTETIFKEEQLPIQPVVQWNEYLISSMKSGVLLMHQTRALERIIFEKLLKRMENNGYITQQLLFPITIQMPPSDAALLQTLLPDLKQLGYDVSVLGNNTFSIQGTPPDVPEGNEQSLLEDILEQIKHESPSIKNIHKEKLLRTIAKRMAQPQKISSEARQSLIDELFACAQPQYTPDGLKIFFILNKEQMEVFL